MKIVGLGTATPPCSILQEDAAAIGRMLNARTPRQERMVEALFRRSGVARRGSVLLEAAAEGATQSFYTRPVGEADRGPGTRERMQRYEAEAGPLAARAARAALTEAGLGGEAITHLVTVSCTGFHAPGPEVLLIERLGLSSDVARTNVGYMGCHGAFNGLRLAESITLAEPAARVLVVAVELCSLHFSYAWDSDKLVANALFADGAAAMVCVRDGDAALQVGPFASRLLPESREAMSWRIVDHGFEMSLSAEVPALIERHVPGWLASWCAQRGQETVDLWAVHPGGPRILDAVERAMRLSPERLEASRRVLAEHGNMSSATIGFILDRLRRGPATGTGIALGFGPGLMAEAFAFRIG